ncbi:MAG: GNAT family N-acetyltransferase [Fluviicola sp.]|nr:GNAT family N-acetyltransferase [Fluviicola sp.]
MTTFKLETQRTILRPLTVGDAFDFYDLNTDPLVLQFTGDDAFESVENAKEFLSHYSQFTDFQVGRFAVIDKLSNEFLGWCGLKFTPETQEYDLGFRFHQRFWSKGYATETACKCLEYVFISLKIERIVGRAMSENTASIKVLEKLGMVKTGTFDFEGKEGVLYHLNRINYLEHQAE